MKSLELALASFENKEAVHAYLAEQLDFPDYYGKNLDALYDVLTTEINAPVWVRFDFSGLGDMALVTYYKRMLKVFQDASQEVPEILVTASGIVDNEE